MVTRLLFIASLLLAATSVTFAVDDRVVAEVSAEGIDEVVLRAGLAATATVRKQKGNAKAIIVEGKLIGGAKGYHPSDPTWKETPPEKWGLNFVSKRFGKTLVVSTVNEIQFIHHRYVLDGLIITVPDNVRVRLLPRELDGDGKPNLSKP